jgi:hypothetical protein
MDGFSALVEAKSKGGQAARGTLSALDLSDPR